MFLISSSLVRRGKHLSLVVLGVLAVLGFLSLSRSNPAQAQGPGVNLTALYNQVQALQATVNTQQTTINNQQATINALQKTVNTQQNTIKVQQSAIDTLTKNLTAEQKRAQTAEADLQKTVNI